MTALSILELVRVTQETDAKGALNNARDLAAHAENWGYHRIWVAEHHNMPGIASAATSVVLGPYRRGDKNDPRRRRWDHAPQPCALMLSPSSSERLRDCSPAASTLAWAAPPALTS